jgi:hypothetical protein
MSYPYPYHVDRDIWASFTLDKPEIGSEIAAPDGDYRVLAVRPGRHASTGLFMNHPELSAESIPSGWFWYGVKLPEEPLAIDACSQAALEDWKQFILATEDNG